ncbi:MAG: hypothetical protein QM695_07615 [Micropruina sp.]
MDKSHRVRPTRRPAAPPRRLLGQRHDGQRLYVVPSEKLVIVRLGFSPAADDIRTEQLVADVMKALR